MTDDLQAGIGDARPSPGSAPSPPVSAQSWATHKEEITMDDNVVLVGFSEQSGAYQALSRLRQADDTRRVGRTVIAGHVQRGGRTAWKPHAKTLNARLSPGKDRARQGATDGD